MDINKKSVTQHQLQRLYYSPFNNNAYIHSVDTTLFRSTTPLIYHHVIIIHLVKHLLVILT